MKKLLLIIFIFNVTFLGAQNCNFPPTIKLLIVGDSWGNFMWVYKNYRESFKKFGYPDYLEEGTGTVENGANASDFIVNPKLTNVINALNNNPDAEWVLMSLGGNDVLGEWHKDFTPFQNDSLLDTIQGTMQIIIDTIKQTKPGVQILISGYDYPNFAETTSILPNTAYTDLFESMGEPTFAEINGILEQLIQRFTDMAQADPQLNIVNNLGLMQYMFGQTVNLIVPPYSPPYPQYSVPLPGGNINYPSPMPAMLGNLDAFHLSSAAYQHFTNRNTELFFWEQFRRNKDTTLVSSGTPFDGFVDTSETITGNQLAFGNPSSAGEVSSILSFNTEAIPDNAIITEARLFLTRSSQLNQNPILTYGASSISMDIKSGYFGDSSAVELIDFSDPADAENIACLVGTAENNDYKIRFEMSDSASLSFINKTGLTQFRLKVNSYDSLALNALYFYGADAGGTNMPILDVKYSLTVSNKQHAIQKNDMLIYPNPTNEVLKIQGANINQVEISNLNGHILEKFAFTNATNPTIKLSQFAHGIYLMRITTDCGSVVKKLILQ